MNKPHIMELEDGSILIEFVKEDRRFGLSFENDGTDSGWYYVSKLEAGDDMLQGYFYDEMMAAWEKFND